MSLSALYKATTVLGCILCLCTAVVPASSYNITENNVLGDMVVDLKPLQTRFDASYPIDYTIDDEDDAHDLFDVNNHILVAKKSIDRDERCPNQVECNILVRIEAKAGPTYYEYMQFDVEVIDQNDNVPMFRESVMTKEILESATPNTAGATIDLDPAEDPDSPAFGITKYNIPQGSTMFDLKMPNVSGTLQPKLTLKNLLDREATSSYELVLFAVDGGGRSSSTTVVIKVIDVNDNEPKFEQNRYETNIIEGSGGNQDTILTVKATDADAEENGRITYSFSEVTDQFGIDADKGEIYLKKVVDYEEGSSYTLTVIAKDNGNMPLSASVEVVINIEDKNDHQPIIEVQNRNSRGHIEIDENLAPDSFVMRITVSDPDSSKNGEFNCSILSNADKFYAENVYLTTYVIKSRMGFDREVRSEYDLTFKCQDHGDGEPLSSTQNIIIEIVDKNDNRPQFQSDSYSTSLRENSPSGTLVYTVNANDADAGDNAKIRYDFEDLNNKTLFNVNERTGEITTRQQLDHETHPKIYIQVVAYDHGTPPLSSTCTVVVEVEDVDDNAPQFPSSNFVFRIPENTSVDTLIGQINATDPDDEPFNTVYFRFSEDLESDVADPFVLDPNTGKLYTRKVLDREAKTVHHLIVVGYGKEPNALENRTSVFVSLLDVNDNPPEIIFPNPMNNTVYVTSNKIGSVATKISARDNDSEAWNKLSYEFISGNEEDIFTIDQDTGAVIIKKDLSSIQDKMYSLNILIMDNGIPPLMDNATLNLFINQSSHMTEAAKMISNHNLNIVISIACISGVLMVILIVAIVLILRKQSHRPKQGQDRRYNYMPHIVEKQSIENSRSNKNTNKGVDNMNMQLPPNANASKDSEVLNNSMYQDRQQPVYASVLKRPSNASTHKVAPPRPGMYAAEMKAQTQNPSQLGVYVEKDSDSACSGDMSNADSGRGSNDDVPEAQYIAMSPNVMPSPPSSPRRNEDEPPPIPTKNLGIGIHRAYPAPSSHNVQPSARRASVEYPPVPSRSVPQPNTYRMNNYNPAPYSHGDYDMPNRNNGSRSNSRSNTRPTRINPPDLNMYDNGGMYLGSHV